MTRRLAFLLAAGLLCGAAPLQAQIVAWQGAATKFASPVLIPDGGSCAAPALGFNGAPTYGLSHPGNVSMCFNGTAVANWASAGIASLGYASLSNCASSAAPAVCGSAPAGSVVIAAAATTVTVNTSRVTAGSQILIQEDSSLGTRLSVTCNTVTGRDYTVTARTANTSFVITSSAAPATNPACLSYFIVN